MGLLNVDDLASTAIGKAEEKLLGESKEEKTTFWGAVLRFFVSLVWLIITFIVSVGAFMAMGAGSVIDFFGGEEGLAFCYLAIGVSFVLFLITFCIPYLRKKGSLTRWCGILALGDAIWWIYLLTTGL